MQIVVDYLLLFHHHCKIKASRMLGHYVMVLFCIIFLQQEARTEIIVTLLAETVTCEEEAIDLLTLNASISGTFVDGSPLNDGYWSSGGDGTFLPGNLSSIRYSTATSYIPGPMDIANGSYRLYLTSDDPDGVLALTEVTKFIDVKFRINPFMACAFNTSVKLDNTCEVPLSPQYFIVNALAPFSFYGLDLFDEDNNLIADNIVRSEHHGQTLSAKLYDKCNGAECWSFITVEDKKPPVLKSSVFEILCNNTDTLSKLKLPIKDGAIVTVIDDHTYEVEDIDNCGPSILTYEDIKINITCTANIVGKIERHWHATDQHGNESWVVDTIKILNIELSEVSYPPNFDNIGLPSLDCAGIWAKLADGHPSPDTTGRPEVFGCTHIESTFQDFTFPLCGAGYKILRDWITVDWCSSMSYHNSQIIKIEDKSAPTMTCPANQTKYTNPYTCTADDVILPFPTNITDCSLYTFEIKVKNKQGNPHTNLVVDNITKKVILKQLPLDTNTVIFNITDECGHKSTCETKVVIKDNIPPIAVCEQFTKLTLGSNGFSRLLASSLDDGSWDNCKIDSFGVRREVNNCGMNSSLFRSYVDFCCEDIGQQHMVIFRVWDSYGNYNDCQVNVTLEDKLPPIITCLPDLTISCDFTYDQNDLSVFGSIRLDENEVENIYIQDSLNHGYVGKDGIAFDNCSLSIRDTAIFDLHCNSGKIIRRFYAMDGFSNIDSCEQTINIVNLNPLIEENIHWPKDTSFVGCGEDIYDIEITGIPSYIDDHCSLVDVTFRDNLFAIADTGCLKLLRKWSVIDWCQYDSQTGEGLWQWNQIIKLENTIAPEFQSSCNDTTFCINSGCQTLVDIKPIVTDECSSQESLNYSWTLDKDINGTIDSSGQEGQFRSILGQGKYYITWQVEDGCGNITECSYRFDVIDCKAPSPYCKSQITTTINASSQSVQIWASDYNIGSSDNCTPYEQLKYSFSQDTNDIFRTFYCSDIKNGIAQSFELEMWVTDLAGNQQFCITQVIIQDNADSCPDDLNGFNISGNVYTPAQTPVNKALIKVVDKNGLLELPLSTSGSNGKYNFQNIPGFLDYGLSATFEGEVNTGVSVIDLVQIQRHILQQAVFQDPLQMIAADVNKSNSISASDLVIIQRAILGLINNFSNQPNWLVLPEKNTLLDIKNAWNYTPVENILNLESNISNANFVAIKMGDVNFSASPGLVSTEVRNKKVSYLNIEEIHSDADIKTSYIYSFSLKDIEALEGMQFAMQLNCKDLEIIPNEAYFSNANFNIIENDFGQEIRFCYANLGKSLPSDMELFRIQIPFSANQFPEFKIIDEHSVQPILMNKEGQSSLKLFMATDVESPETKITVDVYPTMFTDQIKIRLSNPTADLSTRISLFDSSAQAIKVVTVLPSSEESIYEEINQLSDLPSGIYFLHVQSGSFRKITKLIKP